MDFISQLIEQNTVRAIEINKVLVKNETQLHQIEKEQESMEQQNTYISQILDSWGSFLNRIWSYSGKKLLSPLTSNYQNNKTPTGETLVSFNNTEIFTENENLTSGELDYLKQIAPLKEITQNISQNLDRQNQILDQMKNKNTLLENQIQDNHIKIKQILDSS